MSTKSTAPKAADPLHAGPSGCLLALVALIALAAGTFLGARYLHPPAEPSPATDIAPVKPEAAKKSLWTCSMHPQVIRDAPGLCPICHMQLVPLAQGDASAKDTPGSVTIDPAVVQNMGVRTAQVKRGPLVRELRLTGYLNEAQPKIHEINLRVQGWIQKLYANYDGAYIAAGDPLFELYSPEIHQAAGELISATKNTAGHLASLGDAARRKLELYGLGKAQIEALAKLDAPPRTVTFYSPSNGHVLNKAVVEGAGVMAGAKLMDIVDHSELWMDVAVFERDLPFVALGDHVSAQAEANPGAPLEGEVVFIHPHVDMNSRAATARLQLQNPGMTYRPGMYATATMTKRIADDALLIPREAVLDSGARQLVFLAEGGGHFTPQTVTLGLEAGDGLVQVIDGLEEEQRIVTSGQFLLDSESRLKEAVQKYLAQESAAPPAPVSPQMPINATGSTPQIPSATPPALPTKASEAYDNVFKAYFAFHDALAAEKQPEEAVDPGSLMDAVEAFASLPEVKDVPAFEKVQHVVHTLMEEKRDAQREAFKGLSAAIIDVAKQRRPSAAAAPRLFLVHCSMAEASWLQQKDTVANPYLPNMPGCGEVESEITAGGAS